MKAPIAFLLMMLPLAAAEPNPPFRGAKVLHVLPPGPGNPRNTEGSFIQLKDKRFLFAYTKFTGGGGDHAAADIVGRYSRDGGRTWEATDVPIVPNNAGMNVMSVSLLRLRDGRIALFYLRKNAVTDCRPLLRYSRDEARTWSEPIEMISDVNYYVLNNDRVVQLRTGRLVAPVALHPSDGTAHLARGMAMTYLSDDSGATWRRGKTVLECPSPDPNGLQEPGVVELKDGRLMMFIRTRLASQYLSYSSDGGETWSAPEPSQIASPLSPASIKRIPKTGDLLLVWNDTPGGRRTPLTVAISRDEGKTWIRKRNLLDDPAGWYCYTAIYFAGSRVLLGFNDGGSGLPNLSRGSIAWFPVKALYK